MLLLSVVRPAWQKKSHETKPLRGVARKRTLHAKPCPIPMKLLFVAFKRATAEKERTASPPLKWGGCEQKLAALKASASPLLSTVLSYCAHRGGVGKGYTQVISRIVVETLVVG